MNINGSQFTTPFISFKRKKYKSHFYASDDNGAIKSEWQLKFVSINLRIGKDTLEDFWMCFIFLYFYISTE